MKFWILLLLAFVLGLVIGWVDTRPTWDDTGITVGAVLIVAAGFGLMMRTRAWVWGMAVGSGTPLLNIALHGSLAALVALPVAFLGSYAGAFVRKLVDPGNSQAGDGNGVVS